MTRNFFATIGVCFLSVFARPVLAQAPQRLPFQVEISKTDWGDCYDRVTQKLLGSKLVRSPVLSSPDGRFRAYTENRATAFKPASKGGELRTDCANTARLLVAGPNAHRFDVVFVKDPRPYNLVQIITLVDWSPDARYLLFDDCDGTYGSDAGGCSAGVFDTYYGMLWAEGFALDALRDHMRKNCYASIAPQGFSKDGKVILQIGPDIDEEGYIDPNSCVKKAGIWSLDLWVGENGDVTQLPGGYSVQHYGKWADVVSKRKTHRKER